MARPRAAAAMVRRPRQPARRLAGQGTCRRNQLLRRLAATRAGRRILGPGTDDLAAIAAGRTDDIVNRHSVRMLLRSLPPAAGALPALRWPGRCRHLRRPGRCPGPTGGDHPPRTPRTAWGDGTTGCTASSMDASVLWVVWRGCALRPHSPTCLSVRVGPGGGDPLPAGFGAAPRFSFYSPSPSPSSPMPCRRRRCGSGRRGQASRRGRRPRLPGPRRRRRRGRPGCRPD